MKRVLLLFFVSTMGLAGDDPALPPIQVPNDEEIRAALAPLRVDLPPEQQQFFDMFERFALNPGVRQAFEDEMRALLPAERRAIEHPEGDLENPDTMDEEKTD